MTRRINMKCAVAVAALFSSALFHFYYISAIICFIVIAGERHGTSGHRG
jgi:hypothetical protein